MSWLQNELASLRRRHLLRKLRWADRVGPRIRLRGPDDGTGHNVLLFCSNNYLGLADHPELIAAARRATEEFGCSASASRLISGSLELHRQLEETLARWMGTESALVFNSGYQANVGLISALAKEGDVIFSDRLNHASLIDGCRLARAEVRVFRHADAGHLRTLLAESNTKGAKGKRIILTESIFSVDGDRAPLGEIASLAREFDALLIVDEAHGIGVLGAKGTGLVGELGIEKQVDIRMGTLGKALGSFGAFVAAQREVTDYLINRARSFIYSTALPPATLAASLAAIEVVQKEPERRQALWKNVRVLSDGLKKQGWRLVSEGSHIMPVLVGEAGETMAVTEELLACGIFVQGLRPPTVPEGTCRLRLTPMATHTAGDLTEALAAFGKVLELRKKQNWTVHPTSASTSIPPS
ncbi:MAG: 8-amino-7-oxononanoate synthase [Acidobacteria bacterium]|nr:8-amino-7-oxononanoate synthase [Acidobacteriota bacterium]